MEKSKSYSKAASNTMAKPKMVKDKVKVVRFGLMVLFMKVNGKTIWPMEKESSTKKAVGIMREISKMINSMAMESLLQQIKTSSTKDNSFNTNPTASAHKSPSPNTTNTQATSDST